MFSSKSVADDVARGAAAVLDVVAVSTDDRSLRIQEYLDRYFEMQSISICWKTAREFSAELRQRWETR